MRKINWILSTGMLAALISLIVSLTATNTAIAKEIDSLAPTVDMQPRVGWEIKSTSGAAEIALAKHLKQAGVKVYGAYWCPHCYEQKQLFGKEAWKYIASVECAEDALKKPQPKLCKQAGVTGFPTWSIPQGGGSANGAKLDAGVKKLSQLAKLSGYKGKTDFKYDRLFGR
jgi:thiol-disulfide isomerase/thioredoxin